MLRDLFVALVGAVIGGALAWAVAHWQRVKQKEDQGEQSKQSRAHDARLAVEAVISKLEDSELYRVTPHYEIWDRGFPSLNETRMLMRAAKASLRANGDVKVLTELEKLELAHRPLIQLHDSFELFMAKQGHDGIQRLARSHEWPDLDRAADELRRLQTVIHRELPGFKRAAAERLERA
jgi:hypothetical protein